MSKEKQIEETAKTMVDANNKEVADALSLLFARLAEALYDAGYRKKSDLTPCDVCRFNPPTSGDGKPCSICPAQMKGE